MLFFIMAQAAPSTSDALVRNQIRVKKRWEFLLGTSNDIITPDRLKAFQNLSA